jgi:hypothetical protein
MTRAAAVAGVPVGRGRLLEILAAALGLLVFLAALEVFESKPAASAGTR